MFFNVSFFEIVLDSSGNPYVGGNFDNGNAFPPRNSIIKLNPTTGAVDDTFFPDPDGFGIYAIAIDSNSNPILGGLFTDIGGQARNNIAKVNPVTGAADATFNPNADDAVNDLILDSIGNLYVVGDFNNIGGQARTRIAKLNPTTGAVDATFNVNVSDISVNRIALDSNDNPYVAGLFDNIGGQARNRIAKLNPTTGAVDATFNPNVIGNGFFTSVNAIAIDSNGNPILGGTFNGIGGQPRNNIAKVNPTTGAADATFNPNADNTISAIALDKGRSLLYTPNANFNGLDTFTYTAKDSTGNSTPITVSVLVNNSPVLDNSGTPSFGAINQGDTTNTGTLISTIINSNGSISDPNPLAKQGIAITGLDTTNGSWQYTTDGTTWNTFTAAATSARLLASDANTRIRFVPNATYNGTITNAILFKAWDQITGTNGGTANVTTDLATNGASSVFSTANETINITVNPAPTITSVTPVANGSYKVGQNLDFTVTFNQPVTITQGTGSAVLPITLDTGGTVNATLVGTGASNTTQTFRYTVASGNLDTDGIAVGTALTLSGGATIKNASGANASLALNGLGSTTGILVDGVPPTVSSITSTTANGTYGVGQLIPITVQFSEPVNVTGIPQLTLATGGAGTPINYVSGSGSNTLTFNYTVAAGNTSPDLDYLSTGAIALNGGTIKDAATNDATLTLPAPGATNSLGAAKAIVINTLALTVTINQATAQTDPTATLPVNFTVTFSEPVTGFNPAAINLS